MKTFATCVAALTAIILSAGFSNAAPRQINKIAAIVNDDVITERDVGKALSSQKRPVSEPERMELRRDVVERLVDQKLLDQILKKSKIEVSEDELARAIAGVLHDNKISIEQLKAELASKGTPYEQYKKEMITQIKRIKFMNQVIGPQVKITEQDLRDYYQRNQEKFRGSHKAHIAWIVFPLDAVQTQAEFDAIRDAALAASASARKGANFAELAKKISKGTAAEEGGDLGMVDLKDMSPAVADVVRSLSVGQVSAPVLDKNAVVIVKLISLPEISAKDFEALRDNIYAALYDERLDFTLRGYLQKERQKAFIEIR